MYLYHIYCNQNNKLQERVAGSQHWHCQVETSWLYLYKVLNHILSCWPTYNWWPLHYKQQNVSHLHDKYFVPPNKAPGNIVFGCKSYYVERYIKELCIDNSRGNTTYIPMTLTNKEILDNHRSVWCSFGLSAKDEKLDLTSLLAS